MHVGSYEMPSANIVQVDNEFQIRPQHYKVKTPKVSWNKYSHSGPIAIWNANVSTILVPLVYNHSDTATARGLKGPVCSDCTYYHAIFWYSDFAGCLIQGSKFTAEGRVTKERSAHTQGRLSKFLSNMRAEAAELSISISELMSHYYFHKLWESAICVCQSGSAYRSAFSCNSHQGNLCGRAPHFFISSIGFRIHAYTPMSLCSTLALQVLLVIIQAASPIWWWSGPGGRTHIKSAKS